ncbi:MAG: glutamate 5-kinase [Abditibacteriaceae bacterium]
MKTLVIKIGTSTLMRNGSPDEKFLADVARQIAELREMGWRTVIVTSGAIRIGLDLMQRERAVRLPEKQAAAAVGQSLLMRAYRVALQPHGLHVAQLLLTRADIGDRQRFLNARHTMTQLFRWNVVPVVNENDTVSTDEIKVGDNDTLAALTAFVAEADLVLLLSDVEGFFLPGQKEPVHRIERISKEIEGAAGGSGSNMGTGGMLTKMEAARSVMRAGIDLVIAHGRAQDVILKTARGEDIGTRFSAKQTLRGKKRWIAYGRQPLGVLKLHPNARPALVEKGSSLLPVGILEVQGSFNHGALVSLMDENGEYARGLVNYSSEELRRVAGLKSSQLAGVLGHADFTEAIHRDNLILLENS